MKIITAFLIAAICLTALPAGATLVKEIELDMLTARSDCIVIGTVKELEYVPVQEGGSVYTKVTIAVEKTLKGEKKKEVVVRAHGGKIGDKTLLVINAPVFEKGERVLLILDRNPSDAGQYLVSGFFQGMYLIHDFDKKTYAVKAHDKASKIFSMCKESELECLKKKGYKTLPLDKLTEEIMQWVEE